MNYKTEQHRTKYNRTVQCIINQNSIEQDRAVKCIIKQNNIEESKTGQYNAS